MKNTGFVIILLVLLASSSSAPAGSPKTMNVQYKKGEIRENPSYLANVVKEVSLGDKLEVLDTKGAWMKVSAEAGTITGWIHSVYLTKKDVNMDAGKANAEVKASSGEQALATKGFSSQIEAQFKEKNKNVDFTWVNKMEAIKVSTKEMQEFLKAGEVNPPEGGTK